MQHMLLTMLWLQTYPAHPALPDVVQTFDKHHAESLSFSHTATQAPKSSQTLKLLSVQVLNCIHVCRSDPQTCKTAQAPLVS